MSLVLAVVTRNISAAVDDLSVGRNNRTLCIKALHKALRRMFAFGERRYHPDLIHNSEIMSSNFYSVLTSPGNKNKLSSC